MFCVWLACSYLLLQTILGLAATFMVEMTILNMSIPHVVGRQCGGLWPFAFQLSDNFFDFEINQ